METFIEHIAGEYEGGLQYCVCCGAVIIDDRNMIGPAGKGERRGYEPGRVQVSNGNPRITTIADMSDKYMVISCDGRF